MQSFSQPKYDSSKGFKHTVIQTLKALKPIRQEESQHSSQRRKVITTRESVQTAWQQARAQEPEQGTDIAKTKKESSRQYAITVEKKT